ncbi:phospholipid transport system substrate-binding protein [Candidatus Magnetomoraceae bacterium gMMP-15]
MKKSLSIIFLILFFITSLSYAFEPMDVIKDAVSKIINILHDPIYNDSADHDDQKKRVWSVINEVFNFSEMAKRTLGKGWKKLNIKQRDEFTDLFAILLAKTYLARVETYSNEKVIYISEKMVGSNKAAVKTKVTSASLDIPINYKMLNKNGWKIYDVNIEGVSLVRNYRSQFRSILMKEGFNGLIEKLKKKTEDMPKYLISLEYIKIT